MEMRHNQKRKAPIRPSRPDTWFIKGPVPLWWIQRACQCGGKSLNLGMYIWFRYGCGETPIRMSPTRARRYGIGTRQTLHRALKTLEAAGLVRVDRRPGRCARVNLVLDAATAHETTQPGSAGEIHCAEEVS